MSIPQHTREYLLPKVGTYKDLKIREVPVHKPRACEVLVKIHAVSLQYRDYSISVGLYDIGVYDNIVPCSDMAGEVLAVGEEVKCWKKGDRVCCNFAPAHLFGDITPETVQSCLGGQSPGVLTQYRTFPAEALVKIPDHLNCIQASTLPFGLQFAVATGATVIVTSSSNEKLKLAAKLGAKHFINYKETPDWEKEVMKLTHGRGVDHVVEVGGPGTLLKSLASVKHGGGVYVIGFLDQTPQLIPHCRPETSLREPQVTIIMKAIEVKGVYIGSVSQFKDMIRAIEANPRETEPVIDKVFKFDDVQNAYAYMESQKHVGKIVIEVA